MSEQDEIQIRRGIKDDLQAVLELIKELAIYEHAIDQVDNTVDRMLVDGFGDRPVYEFIVAEKNGEILGTSIFYYRYSTWKGKRLYLEDLIVSETMRGQGIGQKLFEMTREIATEQNCSGMMWQVLDWNEPAIRFYEKYKAKFENEWINCHLDF